jgi:hypothetical protein
MEMEFFPVKTSTNSPILLDFLTGLAFIFRLGLEKEPSYFL